MAEIRTHKPSTSAIARAIEEAMGAPVRPVTPGGGRDPKPSEQEGESREQPPQQGVGAATWTGFTVPASVVRGSGTVGSGTVKAAADGQSETGGKGEERRAGADES